MGKPRDRLEEIQKAMGVSTQDSKEADMEVNRNFAASFCIFLKHNEPYNRGNNVSNGTVR